VTRAGCRTLTKTPERDKKTGEAGGKEEYATRENGEKRTCSLISKMTPRKSKKMAGKSSKTSKTVRGGLWIHQGNRLELVDEGPFGNGERRARGGTPDCEAASTDMNKGCGLHVGERGGGTRKASVEHKTKTGPMKRGKKEGKKPRPAEGGIQPSPAFLHKIKKKTAPRGGSPGRGGKKKKRGGGLRGGGGVVVTIVG